MSNDKALLIESKRVEQAREEIARLRSDLKCMTNDRDSLAATCVRWIDYDSDLQEQIRSLRSELAAARSQIDSLMKFDSPSGRDALDRLLNACEIGDGIDQHCAPDLQAVKDEMIHARKLLAEWQESFWEVPPVPEIVEGVNQFLKGQLK